MENAEWFWLEPMSIDLVAKNRQLEHKLSVLFGFGLGNSITKLLELAMNCSMNQIQFLMIQRHFLRAAA